MDGNEVQANEKVSEEKRKQGNTYGHFLSCNSSTEICLYKRYHKNNVRWILLLKSKRKENQYDWPI